MVFYALVSDQYSVLANTQVLVTDLVSEGEKRILEHLNDKAKRVCSQAQVSPGNHVFNLTVL